MAELNRVFLIGNLTRDPELRYIPNGSAVTTLGLAVNNSWTTPQGEKKKHTDFLKVVVWGKQAETCGEYLHKGSPVFVEGRLQYRAWEEKGGAKRSAVEVKADRVQFLGKPKDGASGRTNAAAPARANAGGNSLQDIDLDADSGVSNVGGDAGNGDIPF